MLNRFTRLVRSRWVRSLLAVVVLCLLIWFFGELIGVGALHPFATELVRALTIGALLVSWLVLNLSSDARARARERKLAEGITAAGPDADATASAEELALLGERLREALHALRRAKLGGRSRLHLYELPWYMLIGPPGSGKTTALVNSGLHFPLAETKGGAPIQGIGGTRHCDWWFTDEAVLIDTAGRYTTQDSNEKVDSAAWSGFLKLLKTHRRRQPLNGVLLAISLSDLATLAEGERLAHAKSMRKRVRELHDELGVRVPVYVLFTKADTTVGFSEFFDNLGREEREQVWGFTLPMDDGTTEGGAVAGVGPEFEALLARLNERMLERVQQETDLQRRRLIYGFPQQVAALRAVATEFLEEIFRPSRLEARPLLRGVYFTSGTQDGTSIDRLMGAMASGFGLQRAAVTAWSGTGRSYFLGRLVREVVFGESGLVSLDPKEERRRRWTYRAAYAGCGVALLLLSGLWAYGYVLNSDLVAGVDHAGRDYAAEYDMVAKRGPTDVDLAAVLPPLATLRAIPAGYDDRERATPIAISFGLYQGEKLGASAVATYCRGLGALLQPRLLARLETEMQAHLDKPDLLYEELKAYLILGRNGPLDADTVENFFAVVDLPAGFPSDDLAPFRAAVIDHLHALLNDCTLEHIALNGPVVEQVRGILNREPLADYSYNRLMRTKLARALPEWTVADHATPGGGRIFALRSGAPLDSGVPGIFTWSGFHATFKPLLNYVIKDFSENGWVLGRPEEGIAAQTKAASELQGQVLGLYLDDYVRKWDKLLADIVIQPLGDMASATDKLFLIAAPDSPFRNLFQAIDVETQLSRTSATDAVESEAEKKAEKVAGKVTALGKMKAGGLTVEQGMLGDIAAEALGGSPAGASKKADPVARVDQHFRSLHAFVAGDADGKTPPPMAAAIASIDGIYKSLNEAAKAPNPGQTLVAALASGGGAAGSVAALQAVAKDAPKPVAAILQSVAEGGTAVTTNGATRQLDDAWRSKVLPYCEAAFNRYPFIAGSAQEVPPADFARLLGPGGLIDQFFNDNLKPFVDTSHRPWTWQAGGQAKLGLSAGTLEQFQSAALIRDSLFSNGGQVQVGFSLRPGDLTSQIARATLDVGGQPIVSQHAAPEGQHVQWPGPAGKTLVRITLAPATTGVQSDVVDRDGPWALLRMLDLAHVAQTTPDRFTVTFSGFGGTAGFELAADSVYNVFSLAALRHFHCPAKL